MDSLVCVLSTNFCNQRVYQVVECSHAYSGVSVHQEPSHSKDCEKDRVCTH